jgi:glycosyltransferase involved in cell wall biosynthesis
MRILVIGRSFAPGRGSEPGFTWNWAKHWSCEHDVWVIAHPEFRDEVDEELRRTPRPNLHVLWLELPRHIDPWELSGRRLGIGVHYLVWQELAFRRARTLHAELAFDFVHHVSLGTISAPPKLWRLGIPFVWGPIGGGQTSPGSFAGYFRGERLREMLRTARLRLLPLSPSLRKAARRSMVLATNKETEEILQKAGAMAVYPLLDGALPAEQIPESPIVRQPRAGMTLLWAGAFVPRKGLPLALEALRQSDPAIRLWVAGAGRKRAEWQALAARLGVSDRVEFLGLLSAQELQKRLREADGFLFTSLRDSFGTIILEAMSQSLPVIALDHQGVAANVPSNAALKVPVTWPSETVAALAAAMNLLASSPELRLRLGIAGWEFVRSQAWEHKVAKVQGLVSTLIHRQTPADSHSR